MSHYDYPDDEFDDGRGAGPAPIGVHRAELPAWRSWVSLLAVLILVPILAWGAVKLLGHSSNNSASTAGTTTATPADTGAPAPGGSATPSDGAGDASASAAPTGEADMSTGITLYNGTSIQGLAGRTGERLTAAGYTQVNVSPGAYTVEQPTKTTVYYNSAEQAATAQAVVAALGGGEAVEDPGQAQSNPIVIILREDYPGASEGGAATTSENGPNGATPEAHNGGIDNGRGNNR
ncbi:LytR C-terminal domain-containing protein [Actinomyces gaoshouyii]|uniref:LytR/CpsA/Psr regulator C-terminal domain-containing protein n=1 Tax=Actinomyces gaoshouyii TaxID=1960083 RepID=A0A8H9LHM8_9ACTO|nr:LytR C-terminal domain-containing protein [Actinomyces gaoshouyii]ARD41101.1 hypothetical protein B6G06_00805 [Actinomyces gaoshouyii]GGO94569.1 hypothetical protein GCM10011612_00300 [Actinomyces gaoshouyii]